MECDKLVALAFPIGPDANNFMYHCTQCHLELRFLAWLLVSQASSCPPSRFC